jgi:hypothetical protein
MFLWNEDDKKLTYCLLAVEDKIKFCLELLKMVVSGFIFQTLLVTLTDNNVL